jgi:hypothetical protein
MRSMEARVADAFASAPAIEASAAGPAVHTKPLVTDGGEVIPLQPLNAPVSPTIQTPYRLWHRASVPFEMPSVKPHEVSATDPREFGAICLLAAQRIDPTRAAAYGRYAQQHEGRHGLVFGEGSEYRLAVRRKAEDPESYLLSIRTERAGSMSFLKYLAGIAAPYDLSEGDEANLAVLGHSNIFAIRAAVREHNAEAASSEQLPLPPTPLQRRAYTAASRIHTSF